MVDMPLLSAALRRLCKSWLLDMEALEKQMSDGSAGSAAPLVPNGRPSVPLSSRSGLGRQRSGEVAQVVVELGAQAFVLEAVFDGCLQITQLAAAVITFAF